MRLPLITSQRPTKLKLSEEDSSRLRESQWIEFPGLTAIPVLGIRPAKNDHWKIRLIEPVPIGGANHDAVYVWCDDWAGIGDAWELVCEVDRKKQQAQIKQAPNLANISGVFIDKIPYKSQRDNKLNPGGSCNVTSFAMCFELMGVKRKAPKGYEQYEDELYQYCEDNGLSRHEPHALAKMAQNYGATCTFTTKGTHEAVKQHLREVGPIITHGYFTSFGHIVVIVGYTETGYWVYDPWGEYFSSGYKLNTPDKAWGKKVHMSYGLIDRLCRADGDWWVHYLSAPGYQHQPQLTTGGTKITEAGIAEAAKVLGVGLPEMKAVIEVEAGGSGFFPSGKPKILFEAHWFSDITGGKYDRSHPNISSPRWNRDLYYGGDREWERFNAAAALDFEAAVSSTSWGLGQVMGEPYRKYGFASARDLYNAMHESEDKQLLLMVNFIKGNPAAHKALQKRDWSTFALHYNGEGYKANQYDVKLANAYRKFA